MHRSVLRLPWQRQASSPYPRHSKACTCCPVRVFLFQFCELPGLRPYMRNLPTVATCYRCCSVGAFILGKIWPDNFKRLTFLLLICDHIASSYSTASSFPWFQVMTRCPSAPSMAAEDPATSVTVHTSTSHSVHPQLHYTEKLVRNARRFSDFITRNKAPYTDLCFTSVFFFGIKTQILGAALVL
jgi:hypothetical protein